MLSVDGSVNVMMWNLASHRLIRRIKSDGCIFALSAHDMDGEAVVTVACVENMELWRN